MKASSALLRSACRGNNYGSSIADTVLKSTGSAPPLPPPLEITIAI